MQQKNGSIFQNLTTAVGMFGFFKESGYITCTSYEVEDEFKAKMPRSSTIYPNLDAKNFGRPRFLFCAGLVKIGGILTKISRNESRGASFSENQPSSP